VALFRAWRDNDLGDKRRIVGFGERADNGEVVKVLFQTAACLSMSAGGSFAVT